MIMFPLRNLEHTAFSVRRELGDAIKHRSTVLIIDDHATIGAYLRKSLTEQYYIEEASSSKDGIRLAKQKLPDLIVTALTVRASDNEYLCFHLKHCEHTDHIPIIILSQKNDASNRIRSFNFNADDYLTLPIQQEELKVRIANLIRLRKNLRRKFTEQVELKPLPLEIQSKDEAFLQRVMAVMESNMHNPLFGSEQLARQLGLSPRHLCRKLHALTGHSSNDFIRNLRLQRAADMLDKDAGKVREIATRVGFNNFSYFSKCFKEFHCYSPSDFAKRVR
jgi:DNA-binding response OmpR family regulator